ncbi:MAG TPA: lipoprotein localization protein LolB [Proteus sp.]|uniref:Outer-membrane lipoprotein LolB n=1 Tax=Proteus hauseri ATCC 700826 TaxID=1354271 RepID=A0AAJ3HS12_PROHU|nr:lipoprotein insertase outer membrane protein LolB [Proteus hauseri]OAT46623.1 outer membrane lipoprotein [Proteus hauseri ATCC 700826]HCH51327.1 lipoprotein localization protein LolB [Proteus sp. (in: enterobacteria)]
MRSRFSPTKLLRLLPLTVLLLSACNLNQINTQGSGSNNDAQWQERQQALKKISQYETRGAFAYIEQSHKVYARFYWQDRDEDRYRLLLTNPLGTTELDLNVMPSVIEVTDNKGKKYYSDDPVEMIYQLTGMVIPLKNLRAWLIGLPGDATIFELDAHHLLKSVTWPAPEGDWIITYQAYDSNITPNLPQRLELRQGDRLIKLKMDNWDIQQ